MDLSEYRKRVQAEIEEAGRDAQATQEVLRAPRPDAAGFESAVRGADRRDPLNVEEATRVALDATADPDRRALALEVITIEVTKRHDLIDLVISLLRDVTAPAVVRHTALHLLRAASFRGALFAPKRPDYLEALRTLVEDPDLEIRRQSIEVLAQEKDEYVQRRLIDGLQNPAVALVPPALALEFVGYDIHAEHYPLLRQIARVATEPAVRQQAVRLLSADAASRELLAQVLANKHEHAEVRAASAAALQALAPAEFARIAADVVLDDEESDHLRAASVSALEHFPAPVSTAENSDLIARIRQLQSIASGELKQAASSFVAKHDRQPPEQ